jgi:large subunit ribosomal protein L23
MSNALDARQVLVRPIVTEKSLRTSERRNAYTFHVHLHANKVQIRRAVESIYDVTVTSVQTDVRPGKPRRRGWNEFETPAWKRAVVTLKTGDTLDLY